MTEINLETIQLVSRYGSATLHEAMGRKGALPFGIKPIAPTMKLCGPAVTVSSPPIDNLMLHQALYIAQPGTVFVVDVNRGYEAGYWGEIMTVAAQQRKIAGLVIDGGVRDADLIEKLGFPVFCRGLSIRGTDKKGGGHINSPIVIGDVTVRPGDLVVGDRDGVVIIPSEEIHSTLEASQKREAKEDQIMEELTAGKSTLEIYGWPPADEKALRK
jgi:4-hydroxy-4-methyl-2-oxoglutarate aldolase